MSILIIPMHFTHGFSTTIDSYNTKGEGTIDFLYL